MSLSALLAQKNLSDMAVDFFDGIPNLLIRMTLQEEKAGRLGFHNRMTRIEVEFRVGKKPEIIPAAIDLGMLTRTLCRVLQI